MMENEMGKHLSVAVDLGLSIRISTNRSTHDFEQQCLRILRCTAHALANSPGGLRFKAGTRPWLDALSECCGDLPLSVQHRG